MRVAIQGELGSFSHEAAEKMLPRCTVAPCARSVEVFDRIDNGSVGAAVIPIENTLAGTVAEHADLMLTRDVFIQAEYMLRIVHNVIAMPGVRMNALRRVLSHPVALDQCRDFFRSHPKIEAVPFYDTAGSVKHVIASELSNAAGIAGRKAASEYSGTILQSGIEDDKSNFTRFFLIRKLDLGAGKKKGSVGYHRLIPKGANKTRSCSRSRTRPAHCSSRSACLRYEISA